MAMLGGYNGNASWAGGIYENEYVRERGVWKMKDVRYLPQYSGRYEAPGWTPTKEPTPFHFEASRVGKPILDVAEPARAATPATLATLAKRMADLAARAQRLDDEIEVTNLQHAFGYYVDRKMWDDVADLFARDGTMEIYPRFHIAPLHFDHPVTGRPPQYPLGAAASAKVAEGAAAVRRRDNTSAAASLVRSAGALESLLTRTERSVDRSKAYHASENLATAYGFYIDEFAWDETADIFSRDGWKELSYVGTYVGRERIRQSLKTRYPNPKSPDFLTVHQVVQPVIHISADARSAQIRARLFQMGGPAGGEGSWISGIYENTAIDEDGTWKLSGMDLDYVWTAPSRGGWVRVTTPPTAPSISMRDFPPDRPLRGSIAAPFPRVHSVPFHYRNPVSGRVPPLLLP